MADIPTELRYTKTHEWVRQQEDGSYMVGITDHAQELLGDLVFVELPELATELTCEAECCVVESVKAASDVYCPMTGMVLEINEKLIDAPELINQDVYGRGWLFKLKIETDEQFNDLLTADAYAALITEEDA